jgi:hypothetical protein
MADSKHGFEVVDLRPDGGWVVQFKGIDGEWAGRSPIHPSEESANGEALYHKWMSGRLARIHNLRDQEPGEWRVEWRFGDDEPWYHGTTSHPSEESAAGGALEIQAFQPSRTYRIARIK